MESSKEKLFDTSEELSDSSSGHASYRKSQDSGSNSSLVNVIASEKVVSTVLSNQLLTTM